MKEPILKVNDLTIRYKDAEEPVIKNLSFELYQGEILCIGGKSFQPHGKCRYSNE